MSQFLKFSLLLLSLLPIVPISVSAGDTNTTDTINIDYKIHWQPWSDEAFELASDQNKLVLLDVSATWCQFCKKMKAVTYQNPDVIKIINEHYVAINADIEHDIPVKMRYSSLGVPGTVILTAKREELSKRLGYIAPEPMQWHLLGNLQDAPPL